MNWQAITALRIAACLLCVLCAVLFGGIAFMLDDQRRGLALFLFFVMVGEIVRPRGEAVDTYREFQKHRAQFPQQSPR